MAPLRSFGTPLLDAIGPLPYVAQQSLLDAAAPAGRQIYWKSQFFRALTDDALDALVEQFTTVPSPFTLALIEHIHGAASRVPVDATAFGHRQSPFNLAVVSAWEDVAQTDTQVAWTRACMTTMQPFLADAVYVNYLTAEDGSVAAAYPGDYERLVAVKARYDPTNFFRGNQNIVPSA
jgi:FAD/FMN-containing dehydrogenase